LFTFPLNIGVVEKAEVYPPTSQGIWRANRNEPTIASKCFHFLKD